MRVILTALLAGSIAVSAAAFQEAPDLANGRSIALGTRTEAPRLTACHICHGPNGVGDASGGFPRLNGLAPAYLYKQLQDYASGQRPHPTMTRVARLLDNRQRRDLAFYYATQPGLDIAAPPADRPSVKRGAAIALNGIPAKGVAACAGCHGVDGQGLIAPVPAADSAAPVLPGPALAGQYANYTALQLKLWKRGVRRNSPLRFMSLIAKQLSDEDIRDVALYYESLPPPGPWRPASAEAPAQ